MNSQKQSIVVIGPQGCGKTRNAERIRRAFGLDRVIEWDENTSRETSQNGLLILTNDGTSCNVKGIARFQYAYAMVVVDEFEASASPKVDTAPEILRKGAQHMEDRAALRDQPGGERSMARTVAAFNAITGHNVSERDGWLFMGVLKAARACNTPTGAADDYEDGAAYFGLAGECAAKARAA